jgi:hypothetical protein
MELHQRPTVVIGVLVVILAFHLAVAWQSLPTLARNGFLYDDSFYAFKIAENIAAGHGATFDGVHPTTGFQPLYVLLLVPVYLLARGDTVMPIYIALSLLAVFTSLTAYLIYRIARRYVGGAASVAAAVIWGMSPIVTRQSANGLETAIASFMIALSVLWYLARIRSVERPRVADFATLGVLLGVTILARVDGLFLLLTMLLDCLLVIRRRGESARVAMPVLLLPAGVLLLYGPWLLVNLAATGSPFQDSGAATRLLSLAYAGYFGYGSENLALKGPDTSFIWAHVAHSAATLKVAPPVHVFFRSIERAGALVGLPGAFRTAGDAAGLAIVVLLGVAVVRWRRVPKRAGRRELDFLLLFSATLLAAYSMYIFGMFFFLRYFYPVYLVACLYAAFILQDVFDWFRRRSRLLRRSLVAAAAAYAALFGYFSYSQAFRSHPVYPYYDIARWIDGHSRADEKIGVFQCGTIGYLCHRQIVNLDGKVNRDAFEAMRRGRLADYIEREGIDVVLDHSRILEIFLGDFRANAAGECIDVVCGSPKRFSGWVAYRRAPERRTTEAAGKARWLHAGS